MSRRIWELHAMQLDGAIRTTVEGEAEIDGLVLSERAYFLAVRDFRPAQLVALVHDEGPLGAAQRLIAHFETAESREQSAGRTLVITRGPSGGLHLCRNDEAPVAGEPAAHL